MKVGQLKHFLESMDDDLEVWAAASDDVTYLQNVTVANLTCDFSDNGKKVVVLIYQGW